MLNIIASYNELLYVNLNKLYNITPTSMINLLKLAILKIEVFQSIENFEYRICHVIHNFVSQCQKI